MTSLIRIIIGLGLIIAVYLSHAKHSAAIAAGSPVSVYGLPTTDSGWLTPAFIGIGIVGLLFILIGLKGLLRRS